MDELRDKVRDYLRNNSLRELSQEILVKTDKRYSPSFISLVMNDKYEHDTDEFWKAMSRVFRSDPLSYRDRRKLLAIKLILSDADNPDAIRGAITA